MNYAEVVRAKVEREDRLTKGRRASARLGFKPGVRTPFGYRREVEKLGRGRVGFSKLVVYEPEAALVRFMFKEYLRLRSMGKLVEALANQRTRKGNAWNRAGVAWILHNVTYQGIARWGSTSVMGQHEPLVSPITFNKVQALAKKNDKKAQRFQNVEAT